MGSVARSLYLLSTTLLKPDLQNTLSWKGPMRVVESHPWDYGHADNLTESAQCQSLLSAQGVLHNSLTGCCHSLL